MQPLSGFPLDLPLFSFHFLLQCALQRSPSQDGYEIHFASAQAQSRFSHLSESSAFHFSTTTLDKLKYRLITNCRVIVPFFPGNKGIFPRPTFTSGVIHLRMTRAFMCRIFGFNGHMSEEATGRAGLLKGSTLFGQEPVLAAHLKYRPSSRPWQIASKHRRNVACSKMIAEILVTVPRHQDAKPTIILLISGTHQMLYQHLLVTPHCLDQG